METILGAESADIVPLYARAALVGALVVGPSRDGLPLSGRRLNIVTGIAQQAAIAVVNDQLYREAAERNRIEQELNVARTIQASFMPEENPAIEGCSVASFWQAARQVSGDFYDFLSLSGNRWAMLVADVADKGVPAALFMAVSRTILRTVGFNRQHPGAVLERANEIIFQDTSSDLFVTVFYAVYDAQHKVLHYASGGHNPALHVRRDGSITLLQSEGIALGVLHKVQIEQKQVKVAPGDMLVFYTDGVTEAIDEDFDEFGMDRLCAVVRQARRGTAAQAVEAITTAVSEHAGSAVRFDDMTLVVLKHE
jgi:sigma-B regulation protein RsbU (phosphoserine phosphatase)